MSRRAKNRRYRANLKTRSRLQIACWNAEGLRRKLTELQGWLSESKIDVIAVQEAQFSASSLTEIPGFQTAAVRRRARGRRNSGPAKGGDVAIYVRKGLNFDKLETAPLAMADTTTEWCGIRLYLSNSALKSSSPAPTLDIHNFYRPPIRPGEEDQRSDYFDPSALPTNPDSLLLGDWNAHHPAWDRHCMEEDETGRRLVDWMTQTGVTTLNDGSHTRTSYRGQPSTPDAVFCHRDLARRCTWAVGTDIGSDHLPMVTTVTMSGHRPRRIRKTRWAFHKANWTGYEDDCESTLAGLPEDVTAERLNELFTAALLKCSVLHVPRGARSDPKPWAMDPELEEAVRDRRSARAALDAAPGSTDARDRWVEAKRRAAKIEEEAKARSFRNFATEELNRPANIGRVHKILRKMEGAEQAPPGQALGDHGRRAVEDRTKAAAFAKQYASVSRQVRNKLQDRKTKSELTRLRAEPCVCSDARTEACSLFTPQELDTQLRNMKCGKAPGPDDICAEHLRHLGPGAKTTLLRLLNLSWSTGQVPSAWRRATIIPVPKAGKDPKMIASHRPIALTSHLAKLAERLIAARLNHLVERDGLVPPEQVGFRRGRSAEENLARLVQRVQDGWNKPKPRGRPEEGKTAEKFVLLAFDFSRAYDVIDHKMLRLKLLRLGVPKCMSAWIWAFLRDRRAAVEVNGARGGERPFRAGLPQGSVLAPTLYTLWSADLITALKTVPGTDIFMYADDTATLSSGASIEEAGRRAQRAADIIASWASRWKMRVAGEKTQALVLSQWARDASSLSIKVSGAVVTAGPSLRLLGVTFDRLLHFGAHCAELRKKVRPRVAQLRRMTGRSWGLGERQLRSVANGYIRGALEYAAGAWMPAASASHLELVDRELWAAARVITGCPASTPAFALLSEAGMPAACTRRSVVAARLLGLAMSLPESDPLRALAESTPPRRLKTTTGWRDRGREALARVCRGGAPLTFEARLATAGPPWRDVPGVTIVLEVGPGGRRDCHPDTRREAAESRLAELPAEATWLWSDGSAADGVLNGGGGATIISPNGDIREVRVAAGALCSSTRAELFALRAALEELLNMDGRDTSLPTVVCTDSMAALALLRSGPAAQRTPLAADIWRLLAALTEGGQPVTMQWVPAHCGLPGNERADALAREASALPQHDTPIDGGTICKAVARDAARAWQRSWPDGWYRAIWADRRPGPVLEADRAVAVDIHQLRAGHWSGSAQYLHRIGRRPEADCPQCNDMGCPAARCRVCREEADTPRHVLLRCPALAGRRLRRLGNIHLEASMARDDGAVAALAAGYRAQLSLIGYAP
ncbi:RNA-directed DNA polymerase from mobile element jockey [Amphibalanus amphitrite]|uniref:RNA-directed DNA polymerase from mobile element jockey n=1 Tax=Amphibalanus amphitrite TaxID=1232801 RepID=A0A6A4WLW9_AMPAM|nr:RNA-directed DNA polymerase from mobile element jockey [Amphibalanus amphitrite]